MAEQKELNVMDLNDDCCTAIFRHLKIEDFCQINKIHSKFTVGIENALRCKDANIWLVLDEHFNSDDEDVQRFLVKFGSKIRNLNTTVSQTHQNLIRQYFAGGNVKKCILKRVMDGSLITAEFVAENLIFFTSLKSLDIGKFTVDERSLRAILDAITEIEVFEIDLRFGLAGNIPVSKLLATPITRLDLMELEDVSNDEIDSLPDNTTITTLTLNVNPQTIKVLPSFKAVKSLRVRYNKFFVSSIELENLDDLTLFFNERSEEIGLEEFLHAIIQKNKHTLQSFFLVLQPGIEIDPIAVIDDLCELKNVESLMVPGRFGHHLLEFAMNLKKLRFFQLTSIESTYFRSKDEFIPDLCLFVAENKQLDYIVLFNSEDDNMNFYYGLYDRLARTRRVAGTNVTLRVEILVYNDISKITIHRDRHILMVIQWAYHFLRRNQS